MSIWKGSDEVSDSYSEIFTSCMDSLSLDTAVAPAAQATVCITRLLSGKTLLTNSNISFCPFVLSEHFLFVFLIFPLTYFLSSHKFYFTSIVTRFEQIRFIRSKSNLWKCRFWLYSTEPATVPDFAMHAGHSASSRQVSYIKKERFFSE